MKRALIIGLVIASAACSGQAGTKSSTPRSDRNTITAEELNKAGPRDLFTALQSLRPNWLMIRGTTTLHGRESIKVYLDGSLMGEPGYLRQIDTHSIKLVRYMDGVEAAQRYGLDHGQGAILVFTRVGNQ